MRNFTNRFDLIIDNIIKNASEENVKFLKEFLNTFEDQLSNFNSEFD